MRTALATTTLLSLLLSAACGQSLSVEVVKPAALSMGATETFVLTEGYGRGTAQDLVAAELGRRFDADGYYGFLDHSRYESLDLRPGSVVLPDADIVGAGAWLRVDVLEWYAFDEENVEVVTDEAGRVIDEIWTVTTHANALLAVTAVTEDGAVLMDDIEYAGEFTGDASEASFDEAIEIAGAAAIAAFVADITPDRVHQAIPLDDTVEAHGHALEMARSGQLDLAMEEMQAFVAENPSVPQGHYNLGAFYDAAGDYDAALDAYGDALRAGGESWYANTRTACEQRRAWAAELGAI